MFYVSTSSPGYAISHSAKGSTWEKHKYVKVIDGVYYYPNTYDKGRKIESLLKKSKLKSLKDDGEMKTGKLVGLKKGGKKELSDEDKKKRRKRINRLAKDVISGKYGVGQERMDKLGKKYSRVQNRVNQMLLGKDAAKRIADRKKAQAAASSSSTKKLSTKKKTATKKLKTRK